MTNRTDSRWHRHRLPALALLLLGLLIWGGVSGVTDRVDAEWIRAYVAAAGVWGWGLYVVLFAGGEFIHIPGLVFVAAGILAWGQLLGFLLAFAASIVSVSFSFIVVRAIGGQPLAHAERPWLIRMLSHLDARPIRTVALLRMVMWLAPPLNYALALTNIRFRDYAIGSAIGLLLPLAIAALFFDWLFT